jgi:TRAP-type mannitol/chloroaromatic compound transport system substrate-binding protein
MKGENMNRRTFIKGFGIGAAVAAVSGLKMAGARSEKDKRVWRMVTPWTKDMSIIQSGAERFAKHVGILSEDRLKIQVYAGGELVKPLEVFDAVSDGTVECGHSASYYWAKKVPAAQWFTTVPFGLKASELNTWLHKGGGIELWREVYAPYNVIPMPAGNTGMQMGGWFNKPIMSAVDFKGLKMRMPGLGGRVLTKLGAEVILLPAGEIYAALESGKINATEWIGPYHDMQMGFDRISKFYYAPGWHEPGTGFEFIVNQKIFETLPPDLKLILRAATSDLACQIFTEFEYYNTMAMLKIIQEKKVQLRLFPRATLRELKRISTEVLEEQASRDAMSRKVHDAYVRFKRDIRKFELLKGANWGV